jgi:hypothetical protein
MARLTTEERNKLPERAFAYIDRAGERHLPVHDAEHARNAIARYPQTEFESKAAKERARKRILEAADEFSIELADDDEIRTKAD